MTALIAAAVTQPTPWWQTAIVSFGGALIALLGVGLNGYQATKREGRKAAEDERAQQVAAELAAIADLIAAIAPWRSSIDRLFLSVWYSYNAPLKQISAEGRKEAYQSMVAFAAALWRARITVRNPLARPVLDRLTTMYTRIPKLIDDYGVDPSKQLDAEAVIESLDVDLHEICASFETAFREWDEGLPDHTRRQPRRVVAD